MTSSNYSRPEGRLKWRIEKAVRDSLQPGWNKQLWGEDCTFALVQEQKKAPLAFPHAQPVGPILFCLLSRRSPRYVHVQLKHGGPPGGWLLRWTSWSVEIKLQKGSRRGVPSSLILIHASGLDSAQREFKGQRRRPRPRLHAGGKAHLANGLWRGTGRHVRLTAASVLDFRGKLHGDRGLWVGGGASGPCSGWRPVLLPSFCLPNRWADAVSEICCFQEGSFLLVVEVLYRCRRWQLGRPGWLWHLWRAAPAWQRSGCRGPAPAPAGTRGRCRLSRSPPKRRPHRRPPRCRLWRRWATLTRLWCLRGRNGKRWARIRLQPPDPAPESSQNPFEFQYPSLRRWASEKNNKGAICGTGW